MKNRTNRVTRKITVAVLIAVLTVWLSLPVSLLQSSSSAQTAHSTLTVPPAVQGEQAIAQLKEQGLYDSLQEAVAAARYDLRWEERPELRGLPSAYHAPNPAQQMSAYFTPNGLQLAPRKDNPGGIQARKDTAAEWRVAMRLTGYGYADRLWPVGAAELTAAGDHIEYRRASVPVVEWYINQPAGLEQGFTLAAPPGSKSAGERLRLALELTGELRADLVEEGRAIALRQADGELALRYGGLYVTDANGRELPSQMQLSAGQVWLEADDEGAVYPVTVDPTFGLPVKLTASDGATNDKFGYAIALSGATAVVGAPYHDPGSHHNQGAAYVFARSGGVWTQQAKLTASDGVFNDSFGDAVAINGDTIVVGASSANIGSNPVQGAAYVFERSGGVWSEQAKLVASDGANGDVFGYAVTLSQDTIVVGAFGANIGSNPVRGATYVFVRSGGVWNEQAKLVAHDGAAGDHFGRAVALYEDTLVVGAPNDAVGSNSNQGSAYIFTRNGSAWLSRAKLVASDGAARDFFGYAVAISEDTILVGAIGDDIGSNPNQGSVYVFVDSGSAWAQQAKLTASDGSGSFGGAVSISGDTIIVGMYFCDCSNLNPGVAYVFARSGSLWRQTQKISPSDGARDDFFGGSVSISGGTVAVGAPHADIGSNADQGSAYVFTALWSQQEKLTAVDGTAAGHFGNAASISGSTLVVGASADHGGQGSAYVFTRGYVGIWAQQTKLTASDGAHMDFFGSSVALFNDTIVVGAPNDDNHANADRGSVYVFVHSGGAWIQQTKLTAGDGAVGDHFGRAVAIHEDTLVVGAPGDDVGSNSNQGSAYVFTRHGSAWTQAGKLIAKGASQDEFGVAVALSGETVIVGAAGSNSSRGSAYVFVRGGDSWIQVQKLTASDGAADEGFGSAVAINGNTIVITAQKDNLGANQGQGSAYVFGREGNAWAQQAKLTASDGAAFDQFGVSIALSEDTIVVGAFNDDIGSNTNQGSAYLFARNGSAWTQAQKLTVKDGAAGDKFGRALAIYKNTLVIGAPDDDLDFSQDRGSAYVFGLP